MQSHTHSSADADPRRDSYLLLFRAGGVRLAVEAVTIRDVAGGDWISSEKDASEQPNRSVEIAPLLGFPSRKGHRTLIVDTPSGSMGFVVDDISKREITRHGVRPVPPLLLSWLRAPVLAGFSLQANDILSILDLQRLAEMVSGAEGIPTPKPTDPTP